MAPGGGWNRPPQWFVAARNDGVRLGPGHCVVPASAWLGVHWPPPHAERFGGLNVERGHSDCLRLGVPFIKPFAMGKGHVRQHTATVPSHSTSAGSLQNPATTRWTEGAESPSRQGLPTCFIQPAQRRVAGDRVEMKIENGPLFPGNFTPFQAVRDYVAFCEPRGAPLPGQLPSMLEQADQIESALGPIDTADPCHNDLLLANWIDDGHPLWLGLS